MTESGKEPVINSLWPDPTEERPSDGQLSFWALDGVAEATDGCRVEPDGVCPHGYPSWLIHLGLI
jgi:hypothetical protein